MCCTQYIVSQFGKLSSGHRTRKDQLSFQSQRRAMPNNGQTTTQLCSFSRLARLPSKSFKLSFTTSLNKSIQKEISPEYSLEGLDAEAETPIIWPPDAKNWPTGKDPDAGKDIRQEEKGTTEDETVGWTRWTWVWASSRVLDGQGGLVCCSPWGGRVRHDWVTELKWTEWWTSRGTSWVEKRQRKHKSNCLHSLDSRETEFQKNIYFCFTYYTLKPLTMRIATNWKILKEMGISDHLICLLRNMLCGSRSTN